MSIRRRVWSFWLTFDAYSLSAKYNKKEVGEEGVEKTAAAVVFETKRKNGRPGQRSAGLLITGDILITRCVNI